MKKGITPIISIIILLLITIALAGAAWTYMQGFLFSQISKTFIVPTGGAYCTNGIIKIYAHNTGYQSVLSRNDFILVEVDGIDAKAGLKNDVLQPGNATLMLEWDCKGPDGIADTADDRCKTPMLGYHQVRMGTTSTVVEQRLSCT
jgi:flagellin-like protein